MVSASLFLWCRRDKEACHCDSPTASRSLDERLRSNWESFKWLTYCMMHIVVEEYRNKFGTGHRTVVVGVFCQVFCQTDISECSPNMIMISIFHLLISVLVEHLVSNIAASNTTLNWVVVLDSLNTGWCGKWWGLFVLSSVSSIVQGFRNHSWNIWNIYLDFNGFMVLVF